MNPRRCSSAVVKVVSAICLPCVLQLPSLKVFAVLIALGDYHYDGCELPISFPNDIHSHEVVFHGIPSDTYEDVCSIIAIYFDHKLCLPPVTELHTITVSLAGSFLESNDMEDEECWKSFR